MAGVRRRAKYLLIDLERGSLLLHLGMSGSLRVMPAGSPRQSVEAVDQAGVRIAVGDKTAYDMYLRRTLQHASLHRALGLDLVQRRLGIEHLVLLGGGVQFGHGAIDLFDTAGTQDRLFRPDHVVRLRFDFVIRRECGEL